MFAEMGTNGSVDGSGRLVIKGRFQQKQVENVLRRYIGMFPLSLLLVSILMFAPSWICDVQDVQVTGYGIDQGKPYLLRFVRVVWIEEICEHD